MKVFISHAMDGENLARRIATTLEETGFEVWLDDSQILPGENWAARIAEALQESDAMVVLLTPDALTSKHVRYEIGFALGKEDYSGRLIPVLAGSAEELAMEDIPWILKSLQMIRLSGNGRDEEGLREIAQALKAAA